MDERIRHIAERWYVNEPALFTALCSHDIEPNDMMRCPVRSGHGRIEYSPTLIARLPDDLLELFLTGEVVRILLKHPYERKIYGCRHIALVMASNIVLGDNYDFSRIGYSVPADFNLPPHGSYEWYAIMLERMIKENFSLDIVITVHRPGNGSGSGSGSGGSGSGSGSGQDGAGSGSGSGSGSGQDGSGSGSGSGSDSGSGSNGSGSGSGSGGAGFIEFTLPNGTTIRISSGSGNGSGSGSFGGAGSSSSQGSGDSSQNSNGSGQDNSGQDSDGQNGDSQNANSQNSNSQNANGTGGSVIEIRFEGGLGDIAELWDEDPFMSCIIDNAITGIKNWGTLPGNLISEIMAGTKARIDYRKVLSGFRASILSSKRHLTRMRPNRRTGFDSMGSIRRFDTSLLLAVDVSGSISDQSISHFYSVINRFFKYGIESIDVVQFDWDLGPVQTFTKKFKRVKIKGRGGTNFQPVFDYVAAHPKYDGLVIFTDGIAPAPQPDKGMRTKVVWVCEDMTAYNSCRAWMTQSGRCCTIEL